MKLNLAFLGPWLQKAFSDNGSPSSSRLMTAVHSLVAIGCVIYMCVKTGGHPDAMAITAYGGFATVHYAVNRATTAWGTNVSISTPKPDVVINNIPPKVGI